MRTNFIFLTRNTKAVSANLFFTALVCSFLFSCTKTADLKSIENKPVISDAVTSNKPNIILILGDDIGVDVPTSYGGQSYETPNIDMMAQLGMKFTQCHSSPLCSPSRVCIMTGKYNFRNYSEWGVMDPNDHTFGNLLQKAGYATYVAGKWQLDGGDAGIHGFGFDNYALWNPIKDGVRVGSHYKDPTVYTHAQFLPKSLTKGKYGDDIFTDSCLNFIDQNKDKNFFLYFPITLCHDPFCPTPDDPEFATWDSKGNPSDTSFFPSMIKYMDKKIGQIIQRLKDDSIYDNTMVIFVGDNGTPNDIWSWYNGELVQGGKSLTKEAGTHVPMTILWPKRIAPGQVNDNLVDFTDFLGTFADAARTKIPASFGTVDTHSFFNQLVGLNYTPRDWIFDHYQPNTNKGNDILVRWVQDHTYKLYDSVGTFYNIAVDPDEKHPIKKRNMTDYEKQRKKEFQSVLDSLHS